ncbi:cell division protein ZapE [Agarilytica rhodophyticola]|uniref:cell division protein ZapE n=1 Tax=Agarilytica rhodophyticola TaxID=1737490 RepID=UPI000B348F51|nr:cell division protein ZapE [Agarilytica rhodophyticola]
MSLSPQDRYLRDLSEHGFQEDDAQKHAIEHLQALYQTLIDENKRSSQQKFIQRIASLFSKKQPAEVTKGLYFWGGVGRGKTYLMDIFYDSLPFENKMRTHFHRFMRRVHKEMKEIKDQSDPLVVVANKLADEAKVICFDEFFVVDITDAMILANLLEVLFKRGVVLVTTSNIVPDGLYKDGLQRARFLPAIDLLNHHTTVVNVDGGIDYRLRTLTKATLYHTPLSDQTHQALEVFFYDIVADRDAICEDVAIEVEGREIRAVKEAEDVVWFQFSALCDGPRSQNDYIEIAREYHTVIVENVPSMGAHNDDQARRFIYMVDEFYDRGVKLMLSAELPMPELYQKGRLSFEFERTLSRIQEMQSQEYLACPHLG